MTVALYVLAATIVLLVKGGDLIGPNLQLLEQFFVGYSVTWGGALIGALWGLTAGFAVGWSFAFVHNIAVRAYLVLVQRKAEVESLEGP